MANQKYIKVTPKGETKARIVLASNKNFYLSIGAKVETPTDEEIWEAEPTERPVTAPKPKNDKELANLRKELAEANTRAEQAAQTIKEQEETIAELRNQLQANETTISESEAVIENLRKELAEAGAKSKPAKEGK